MNKTIPWELMKFLSNDQIIKVMELKDFVLLKPVVDEDVFDLKKFKKLRCEVLSEKITESIFKYIDYNVKAYNNNCHYLASYDEIKRILDNILVFSDDETRDEVIVSKKTYDFLERNRYRYKGILHCDNDNSDEMYVKVCKMNEEGKVMFRKLIFDVR